MTEAGRSQQEETQAESSDKPLTNRRGFVTALGAGGLGLLLAKEARAVTVGPLNPTQRRDRAFQIRSDQAVANRNAAPTTVQPTNGDEEQLANKIGTYT